MSNRIEGTRRKLSHMPTGRLKPLRLFSTLLPISNKVGAVKFFSSIVTRAPPRSAPFRSS
jgi:hypothetical protein